MRIRQPNSLDFGDDLSGSEQLTTEANYLDNQMKLGIHFQEIEDRKQNREERKKYADGLFSMVCVWLMAVIVLVGATGMGKFTLSDSVLITLITTSTASVIGIFLIVVRYLFKGEQ